MEKLDHYTSYIQRKKLPQKLKHYKRNQIKSQKK